MPQAGGIVVAESALFVSTRSFFRFLRGKLFRKSFPLAPFKKLDSIFFLGKRGNACALFVSIGSKFKTDITASNILPIAAGYHHPIRSKKVHAARRFMPQGASCRKALHAVRRFTPRTARHHPIRSTKNEENRPTERFSTTTLHSSRSEATLPPSEREVAFSQENDGRSERNLGGAIVKKRVSFIHAHSFSLACARQLPLGGSLCSSVASLS